MWNKPYTSKVRECSDLRQVKGDRLRGSGYTWLHPLHVFGRTEGLTLFQFSDWLFSLHSRNSLNKFHNRGVSYDLSESPSKGTIRTILPWEIAYSQKSIGLYGYYDIEDEASVREWHNVKPCNNPLDVVTNEVTANIAFDNRHLYAARNYAPPEQHLIVNQHNFTDPVPQSRVTTGAAVIMVVDYDGFS